MKDEPSLSIKFFWDNTAGVFWGELPSGARFAVSRNEIGGKLESNLTLFRQAVTPQTDARRVSPSKEAIRAEIANLDLTRVKRFVGGKLAIDFNDLEIDYDSET